MSSIKEYLDKINGGEQLDEVSKIYKDSYVRLDDAIGLIEKIRTDVNKLELDGKIKKGSHANIQKLQAQLLKTIIDILNQVK
jgi:hypothetical protein